jgi:hypothetical protein
VAWHLWPGIPAVVAGRCGRALWPGVVAGCCGRGRCGREGVVAGRALWPGVVAGCRCGRVLWPRALWPGGCCGRKGIVAGRCGREGGVVATGSRLKVERKLCQRSDGQRNEPGDGPRGETAHDSCTNVLRAPYSGCACSQRLVSQQAKGYPNTLLVPNTTQHLSTLFEQIR